MQSIEDLAKEKLAEMKESEVKKLLTPLRSTWTGAQVETLKVDKITTMEIDSIVKDEDLQKLAIQKRIIDQKITARIDEILKEGRTVPYQVSEKGVRIEMDQYNLLQLAEICPEKGLIMQTDPYSGKAYIKPASKGMTTEGAIPVIKPLLESAYLAAETSNAVPESEPELLPGEQLEAHLKEKGG